MDGRGRALDNVFVERLWRSVKYEEVYLQDYADGWEAERSLAELLSLLLPASGSIRRLDYRTPAEVYHNRPPTIAKTGAQIPVEAGLTEHRTEQKPSQPLRPRETREGSHGPPAERRSLIQGKQLSSIWGPPPWRRLRSHEKIAFVIEGRSFKDGILQEEIAA